MDAVSVLVELEDVFLPFRGHLDKVVPKVEIEQSSTSGIKVIGAIAIFVIGKWVAKKLSGLIKKLMDRGEIDATLSAFIANIVDILLMVVVVLAAMAVWTKSKLEKYKLINLRSKYD